MKVPSLMPALLLPVLYLLAGAGLGAGCARWGGDRFDRHYPTLLRTHVVTASLALSVVAAWRAPFTLMFLMPLTGLLLADTAWSVLAYRLLRRSRDDTQAAAQMYAGTPNTGFWAVPAAAALAGPAGVLAAVIYDRMSVLRYALTIRYLRADAPIPQTKRSGWVDHIALFALAAGLLLRLTGPAPSWTEMVLAIASPVLGVTGGFVLGAALPRVRVTVPDLRQAAAIIGSRFAALGLPVAALALMPGRVPTAVVAAAAAVATASAPFSGPGLAKMYGYRVAPVVATLPVSLILAPVGVLLFHALL